MSLSILNRIEPVIHKLTSNSKRLFLIDGAGGLMTTFSLFAILEVFETSFGIPSKTLYFLSFLGCVYTIYSFSCYFLIVNNWRPFLKVIIMANSIYCCITMGLVLYFFTNLTILGLIYFSLEIVVITGLIILEMKILSKN